MLYITDRAHFAKNIRYGTELVVQLRFADIAKITAQDLRHKQDEQPAGLVAFRPVPLAVSAHDAFHHVEVFFLFVPELVMMLRQYRVCVDLKGRVGKETCFPFFLCDLLFIKFGPFQDACGFVVLRFEAAVRPFYRGVIIQRGAVSQNTIQGFTLCGDGYIKVQKVAAAAYRIEVQVQLQTVSFFDIIPVAFDLILKVELLIIDPAFGIDRHPLRKVVKRTECLDLFLEMLLPDFGAHDHRLSFVDVQLKVTDRFITAVGDQDYILKARRIEVMQDGLRAPEVRGGRQRSCNRPAYCRQGCTR